MGWELPKYRYCLSMIRFWNDMCKLGGNNLTKKMFEWSLQNFIPDTWEFNILTVLETIILTNHFDNCDEVDITEAQHRLQDLMTLELSAKISSKPKLRSYSFFKHSIYAEPYVTSNLSKGKQSLISQLRVGILPLEVESGRYVRKKLTERLCKLVHGNVEDEIHFICLCPNLNNIRSYYFCKLNVDVCKN